MKKYENKNKNNKTKSIYIATIILEAFNVYPCSSQPDRHGIAAYIDTTTQKKTPRTEEAEK